MKKDLAIMLLMVLLILSSVWLSLIMIYKNYEDLESRIEILENHIYMSKK